MRDHAALAYLLGLKYESALLRFRQAGAHRRLRNSRMREYLTCPTSDRLVAVSFDSILDGDNTGKSDRAWRRGHTWIIARSNSSPLRQRD